MEAEVAPLRAALKGEPTGDRGSFRATAGGRAIDVHLTGAGKAGAAFAAGLLLGRRPYRLLVNVGCAGAFPHTGLSVGDVVIADREVLSDEGSHSPEGFLDLEALGLPSLESPGPVYNEVPIRPPCRLAPKDLAELSRRLGISIRAGPLSTASGCSGTDRRAAEVYERWRPLAESMEGAALALAALRSSLPFLEVRGISNLAGDRRRPDWDIPRAIDGATAVLLALLEQPDLVPEASAGGRSAR